MSATLLRVLPDEPGRVPSGFARYTLGAMNPGLGSLPERVRARLESVLGCRVRVIWAHH